MKFNLHIGHVLFLLIWHLHSPAQISYGINFGAGLSMPKVTQSTDLPFQWTAESKTGLLFGVFSHVPMQAHWAFRPSLQLTGKGYKEVSFWNSYTTIYINGFTYLELPLTFVHTSKADGNGLLIGAGPAPALLLGNEYQTHLLKRMDLGLNLLLGYQTPIGFSTNLSYTHGLINANKQQDYIKSFKNRFAALTVGYLF